MFPEETLKKQSNPILKVDDPELDDSEIMSQIIIHSLFCLCISKI